MEGGGVGRVVTLASKWTPLNLQLRTDSRAFVSTNTQRDNRRLLGDMSPSSPAFFISSVCRFQAQQKQLHTTASYFNCCPWLQTHRAVINHCYRRWLGGWLTVGRVLICHEC